VKGFRASVWARMTGPLESNAMGGREVKSGGRTLDWALSASENKSSAASVKRAKQMLFGIVLSFDCGSQRDQSRTFEGLRD
jgi:hypothetical protein